MNSKNAPDWVTQTSDPEDQQAREIYALAGLALFSAQVLEHGIVNILVCSKMLRVSKRNPGINLHELNAQFDALFEKNFKRTLGDLIKSLASIGINISHELSTDLTDSLTARNRLAHDFFRERAEDFFTDDGKRLMAEELRQMHELFHSTDRKLKPIHDQLVEIFGITQDRIDHMLELVKSGASKATIEREVKLRHRL